MLSLFRIDLKTLNIFWLHVWRSEYSDTFNLNIIMNKIRTYLFELFNLTLAINLIFLGETKILKFLFVGFRWLKSEIMITPNNNFVFIWQPLYKLSESLEIFRSWWISKITRMNEDISRRKGVFLELSVIAMSIWYSNHSNFSFLPLGLCLNFHFLIIAKTLYE